MGKDFLGSVCLVASLLPSLDFRRICSGRSLRVQMSALESNRCEESDDCPIAIPNLR